MRKRLFILLAFNVAVIGAFALVGGMPMDMVLLIAGLMVAVTLLPLALIHLVFRTPRSERVSNQPIWNARDGRFLRIERDRLGQWEACIVAGFPEVRRYEFDDQGEPRLVWQRNCVRVTDTLPAIFGGVVVAQDHETQEGFGLLALDPKTGEVLWRRSFEKSFNSFQSPLLHHGNIHVVFSNTGEWVDLSPASGDTVQQGAYQTSDQWESTRLQLQTGHPQSRAGDQLLLEKYRVKIDTDFDGNPELEFDPVNPDSDYYTQLRRPDLPLPAGAQPRQPGDFQVINLGGVPDTPLTPEEIHLLSGFKMPFSIVENPGKHFAVLDDKLIVLGGQEKFGNLADVHLAAIDWKTLSVVAKIPTPYECHVSSHQVRGRIHRFDFVDDLVVVILSDVVNSLGEEIHAGVIIDPSTWKVVAGLPNSCNDEDERDRDILLFDPQQQESGRIRI